MRKFLLVFLMIFAIIISCDSDNLNRTENYEIANNAEFNSGVTAKSNYSSSSSGALHNMHLEDMLLYLSGKTDISASNIDQYSYEFFNRINYGELATTYYNDVRDDNELDFAFSTDFKNEIQNLKSALENADFIDLNEFQNFVSNYEPAYISDKNELVAWSHYADVFSHSFVYWEQNFETWSSVLNGNSSNLNKAYPICGIYVSWWKRAWCNVKTFALMDAASAGGYALGALITGNPVVIGAVGTAALGGSVRSVISAILD